MCIHVYVSVSVCVYEYVCEQACDESTYQSN